MKISISYKQQKEIKSLNKSINIFELIIGASFLKSPISQFGTCFKRLLKEEYNSKCLFTRIIKIKLENA